MVNDRNAMITEPNLAVIVTGHPVWYLNGYVMYRYINICIVWMLAVCPPIRPLPVPGERRLRVDME